MLTLLCRPLRNADVLRIRQDSGTNHSRVQAPATAIGWREEGENWTFVYVRHISENSQNDRKKRDYCPGVSVFVRVVVACVTSRSQPVQN
jgi:hypothetical protein